MACWPQKGKKGPWCCASAAKGVNLKASDVLVYVVVIAFVCEVEGDKALDDRIFNLDYRGAQVEGAHQLCHCNDGLLVLPQF